MKKVVIYAWVAALAIPGVLCIGNYIGSLTVADPQAAFNRGQYRDAMRGFRRMLEKNPDDTFTRISLGLAYDVVGLSGNALKEYKQAVLRSPDGFIAAQFAAQLMIAHRSIGDAGLREWKDVEKGFDAAMESRGAADNLASYNMEEKVDEYDIKDSLAALAKHVQEQPGDVAAHLGIGFSHWRASAPDTVGSDAAEMAKASAEFRAALDLSPQDPLANFALIMVERSAAEKDLENGDHHSAHLGAMDKALKDAVTRLPNSALPIAAVTCSPYTPEVYRACLPQVQGWARDHPDSAIANFALAWVYATNSRHTRAAAPGWDEKAEQPLKAAQALARKWEAAKELGTILADARQRTKQFLKLGGGIPGVPVKPADAEHQHKPAKQ